MPPDINWNEAAPPTTESAGLGAQQFQSLKTAIRTGLDAEHTWPTSGLGAGTHRLGAARAYYGPQSLVSSSGTDGRLMVTSDSSRLFHVGSAGTMLLGGAGVLSIGSPPVGGQRSYWADEFGTAQVTSASPTQITIPNSGYSGIPFVWVSAWTDLSANLNTMIVQSLTQTSFFVTHPLVSNFTIMWRSSGTRTF